jgi:hypothetical protein
MRLKSSRRLSTSTCAPFLGNFYHLSFAKTLQRHKSRPVTTLRARPRAIHFKRILDFGEGQDESLSYDHSEM